MPKPLRNKVALITGAARRIGREISLALAQEGMNLVLHYRTSGAEANGLCDELNAGGIKAWTLQADLRKPDELNSLVDEALEFAGSLDLLVNNASEFPGRTLESATFDDLTDSLRVNAWAPLVLSRKFYAAASQGQIINLLDTQIAGFDFAHAPYILAKQLLAHLTRMTALRFAPKVAVNAIAPGLILPPEGKDDSYLAKLAPKIPLARHGDPQEVADAVVFLAKSRFITGQTIFIDGGQHLSPEPRNG